jgi:allantoin racemase
MSRICFLNPFGTDDYDNLISETLTPSLRGGTEIEIRHLDDCPRNLDYFVPKHLVETEIIRAAVAAERDGFDALVIGCCYDPALEQAREALQIPVVGPLEASVSLAHMFGHRFSVVTDHRKAAPKLEDLVRIYGLEANCRSVRAIDWWIDDMIGDPKGVALDAAARARRVMEEDGAEVVVLGCTIIAACLEQTRLAGAVELDDLAIINPNLIAVKTAELLADLAAVGQYQISRAGFYQRHEQHDPVEAAEVRALIEPQPTKAR